MHKVTSQSHRETSDFAEPRHSADAEPHARCLCLVPGRAAQACRWVALQTYRMEKFIDRIKISRHKQLRLVLANYCSEDKYLLKEYDFLYLVRDKRSRWRLESPQGSVIAEPNEIDQLNVRSFFEQADYMGTLSGF